MKKLIFVCLLACLACSVKAQTGNGNLLSRYSVALDTVTNTGVKNMTVAAPVNGAKQTVTISTVNTTLTGTLAGIARLWGSTDGVNYSRIRATQLQGAQVDSLVIDANHKVYHWAVLNNPYNYYQVQTTGVGTVTFTIKGKYVSH